jgi:hypothetical protein
VTTRSPVNFLLSAGLASALMASCSAQVPQDHAQAASSVVPRRTPWLDRPWELRYFFYVTDSWASSKRVAKRRADKAGLGALDKDWELAFEPTNFFQSRDRWAQPGDGLSVVVIEFAHDGTVKTPNSLDLPLRGRFDQLMYVTLGAGDYATQPRFNLGEWFTGIGDVSTHWAPALCGTKNMPSPFSKTDSLYLYGPKFVVDKYATTFGCREWAYQLDDTSRPYVDITSYVSKPNGLDDPGTYIRETIGWARFQDKKPVIGKHLNDWFCLHDCPNGDKPGLIPDMKAWAARNGWPEPKPPTKVPTFPDPPAKAGTYPG